MRYGNTQDMASNLITTEHGTWEGLINYNTIIALKKGDKIMLDSCYYSHTTSKNQNEIKRACSLYGIKCELIAHEDLVKLF